MGNLILPLSEANKAALSGGKATSLKKLIKSGFNVPAGFVVAASAMDEGLRDRILIEFDNLGSEKVAVRSSAVAEDGASDAWAGQLDTYLNVTRNDLLEKVELCFASAGSDRAKSYASQKNIDAGKVAVIVQKMVPSEISGVAFSAHPITGSRDNIVIEAVMGLGEKLVSGAVTPDTYVIAKTDGEVIEKHIPAQQILNTSQLIDISQTIQKIEEVFGFPVDVEWAYSKNRLYILQSRPITTLG